MPVEWRHHNCTHYVHLLSYLSKIPTLYITYSVYRYIAGSKVDEAGISGEKYQDERKKYSCDQCEYSTGRFNDLKRHKEIQFTVSGF